MRNLEKDEAEMAARRDLMLSRGFRLFAENGIEPVAMQRIAKECGVGIATLYRYYNTKLALVIDIGAREWVKFGEYIEKLRQMRDADHMTAAKELEFYLDCCILLYTERKALLRFNQDFNNFVRHEGATLAQLKSYLDAIGAFSSMFRGLYGKGKRDGTIRTELSEEKMFAAMSHIMLAVALRYAQGLLWAAGSESDRTEEYLLLKKMVLREFVPA